MDTPLTDFILDAMKVMNEQRLPSQGRMFKMNEQHFRELFLEMAPNMYPSMPSAYIEFIIYMYLYNATQNDGMTGLMVFGAQITIHGETP